MCAIVVAVLELVGEGQVALESVDVKARLRGLLSETKIIQVYRNLEAVNIEVVYTFPLPLDAVLLELELVLNMRTLRGVVQPRAQAEGAYEDAVDEVDAAVLLQAAGPGLFTLNVGNLLPGETARVRMRYAQLHRWQGDSLRFHLPTTIAPRYGEAAAGGLAPHQVPEHALTADDGFSLTVTLQGAHATADFECPSHPVEVRSVAGARAIRLSGGAALMDRDFVLVVRESATVGEGLWAADDESFVALASFHPHLSRDESSAGRRVTLVVDCSGSMGGDSMAQAKVALAEILGLLRPADRFNLIAFGSTHRSLFLEPVLADPGNIEKAQAFVARLDATMGGTEIGQALEAAYQQGLADILLITDGEVWDHARLMAGARGSGQRVFTVGVGSVVAEAFVRDLAERTGGACELVSPREEDMAERIVRHFRRIDQPCAAAVEVEWPERVLRQAPERIGAIYNGDTLHVLAWLVGPPADHATLTVRLDDGRMVREQVVFRATPTEATDPALLPRVAAHQRLRNLARAAATEIAVRYQLVSEHTSCVLVHERAEDEKADTVPALRKVPQMLAAGWGGAGTVRSAAAADAELRLDMLLPPSPEPECALAFDGYCDPCLFDHVDDRMDEGSDRLARPQPDLPAIVAALNARYPDTRAAVPDLRTFEGLAAVGFAVPFIAGLAMLVDAENPEEAVVLAVLAVVAESEAGAALTRNARRLIRKATKQAALDQALIDAVAALMGF